jgi:phosphoribulokinase
MDIMAQDIAHLRRGKAILKPVYRHTDGTFGPPMYVEPHAFAIVEGLLGYHTRDMREAYDVRVYLAPPEELRRRWKVDRDCSRRGYTTDEVLAELDRREHDSAAFIRPQEHYADIVVSFMAGDAPERLDAALVLRDGLAHPDLSPFFGRDSGIALDQRNGNRCVRIPGNLDRERAAEIEHAIWQAMHFASHLRTQRLGEFTIGTELHRSESLALVQLLILYHLVTAKAAVALGGPGMRADAMSANGSGLAPAPA